VKLFVTARAERRAERRYRELKAAGQAAVFDEVLDEVRKRDARDMERVDAPLRPADGSMVIDTTDMDIGEAVSAAESAIRERLEARR
jgi:cytidylate kinase